MTPAAGLTISLTRLTWDGMLLRTSEVRLVTSLSIYIAPTLSQPTIWTINSTYTIRFV